MRDPTLRQGSLTAPRSIGRGVGGVHTISLRSSNSAQTAAASLTTMRVSFGTRSPQALRFSARSEGGGRGLHTGHCFARPVVLRCARLARALAQHVGSAQRVTDTRRSCECSSRVVPVPHPFWLRREAQELGWVHVPQDTCTSSSGSSMLSERSSPAGGTQRDGMDASHPSADAARRSQ